MAVADVPRAARVLVTGSRGFLGRLVIARLEGAGHEVAGMDVEENVLGNFWSSDADVAIHLAADKFATIGEIRPLGVADLNIWGTQRVVDEVPRVILASTCKAADACTVYGASKLIAERIVLNAGGTVVRLVNVIGSAGSVSEVWAALPADEPLPVTSCERLFITPQAAVELLVGALELPPGRYGPAEFERMTPLMLASRLYPDRNWRPIPLRRGDRQVERLVGENERAVPAEGPFVRILDAWERSR